eukprot:jgi/Botrbrau1/5914/Bobra.0366s0089.1
MRFGEDVFERLEREGSIPVTWTRRGRPFPWILTKEDMAERMATDMQECCRQIRESGTAGEAVALIHGTEDKTIGHSESAQFHKLIPGSQLRLVEGACHNFRSPEHAALAVGILKDFILLGTLKHASE